MEKKQIILLYMKEKKIMNDMIPVGKATNIIGKQYGKLVVLYRVEPPKTITTKKPKSFWKC